MSKSEPSQNDKKKTSTKGIPQEKKPKSDDAKKRLSENLRNNLRRRQKVKK